MSRVFPGVKEKFRGRIKVTRRIESENLAQESFPNSQLEKLENYDRKEKNSPENIFQKFFVNRFPVAWKLYLLNTEQ